jgi:hypothetical protein
MAAGDRIGDKNFQDSGCSSNDSGKTAGVQSILHADRLSDGSWKNIVGATFSSGAETRSQAEVWFIVTNDWVSQYTQECFLCAAGRGLSAAQGRFSDLKGASG